MNDIKEANLLPLECVISKLTLCSTLHHLTPALLFYFLFLITVCKMAAEHKGSLLPLCDITTLDNWLLILFLFYLDQTFTQAQTFANTVTNHTLQVTCSGANQRNLCV